MGLLRKGEKSRKVWFWGQGGGRNLGGFASKVDRFV